MTVPEGDTVYFKVNASSQQWYKGDFISALEILVVHCAHIKDNQGQQELPQLLHVTYAK
jgi:hypothetical protein